MFGSADKDMFDVHKAGVFPMIFGTAARVILMTLFVIPVGVTTAIYLTEYAHATSPITRVIRGAVNNSPECPRLSSACSAWASSSAPSAEAWTR